MAELSLARSVAREYAASLLPHPIRWRLVGRRRAWTFSQMRRIAKARDADVRLLVAPANSASQAYYWARAAETLPGVSACNMVFGPASSGMTVDSDVAVHPPVARYSKAWALRQRKEILDNFTHVIYEAEYPILPSLYDGDLAAEINDLQSHGIKVAMLSHGSDVRTPSEHVEAEPHSPFRDPLGGLTEALEVSTGIRRAALDQIDAPKYVSTPDLLRYVPQADWLPTLTDPTRWVDLPAPRLGEHKLRVLHVPSRSALKGTAHIRPAMERLQDQGLIEYTELEGVPYQEMPERIAEADLVIDQVSMGVYGVASVESMLAGRPVIAQAGDFVRRQVEERTGWALPIIEATPDTIEQVVADIAQDPAAYAQVAQEGRKFALEVHSQKRAAEALRPFLFPQAQGVFEH